MVDLEGLKIRWTAEQIELRGQLQLEDPSWLVTKLNSNRFLIGGLDISFSKLHADVAVAALAVINFDTLEAFIPARFFVISLELVHYLSRQVRIDVPYIPTFLGYREVGPYVQLVHEFKTSHPDSIPDVLMVDGNGTLHPRGCGSACQVGYQLQMPTIGVAKNWLELRDYNGPPEPYRDRLMRCPKFASQTPADRLPIKNDQGEVCGVALFNNAGARRPVYVSPGHQISLGTACDLVLKMSKFRTPEPIRVADQLSRREVRRVDSLNITA
ncbi:endonuclease V [Paragonimus westermani]|uniref:Endonuclease V n=1 Tax=Paragonimus westermani TaxID=34504 RepID=A0A5J4NNT5_9TREM|nr:endonuclease V [Paragonimus westermani]